LETTIGTYQKGDIMSTYYRIVRDNIAAYDTKMMRLIRTLINEACEFSISPFTGEGVIITVNEGSKPILDAAIKLET